MTEEQVPVSEVGAEGIDNQENQQEVVEQQQEERQVPLSALEAERRKRQEMEAENRIYQQYLQDAQKAQQQPQEDDSDDWVTKKEYRQSVESQISSAKREILEEAFVQANPDAHKKINDYLPELMKQKPWVKEVIENAPNRWQRAWELVNDLYMPQQSQQLKKNETAQKIVENSQKPGSPTIVGKSHTASTVEYMRSVRGTSEWDDYRAKLRRGEASL